jgi:hypothetical protein
MVACPQLAKADIRPLDGNSVFDPLLPSAAQGFRIATLTLEPYFASRNFML